MEIKSKTEKKRDALLLQELGEKLFKLPETEIKKIDLPEEICYAVKFAKSIKSRGALKRQLKYIGVLMRKIDPEPIKEALRNIEAGNLRSKYK
jgi:ribosome-associated protein